MKTITKIEGVKLNKSKKLKVAAYARVSTKNNEQLTSLTTQKAYYENYIKSHNDWEFVNVYYDEGISGTKIKKRDGFKDMVEDCYMGKIDLILVKSISRFSRNTLETIEAIRNLCNVGVNVCFEKENIDTRTMDSELILSILSSLAQSESKSISDNVKWSVKKRFENGTFIIGYPPYGYKNIDGKMVIDEMEAKIVKEIFNQTINGIGTIQIARILNERGVKTKRNKKWCSSTILAILKNEKYIGDALFQKKITDSNFNRHINHGEEKMYYAKNHHEAIIDKEIYDKANEVIKNRGYKKGIVKGDSKYQNRYAFSGKIVCNECGEHLKRVKIYDNFKYACNGHIKDKNKCSLKPIEEKKIKDAFLDLIKTFDKNKAYNYLNDNFKSTQISIDKVNEELADIDKKKDRLNDYLSKGLIELELFTKEMDELNTMENNLVDNKNLNYSYITGTEIVKQFVKDIKEIDCFDDELFTKHVDKIIVYDREHIGFLMKYGETIEKEI